MATVPKKKLSVLKRNRQNAKRNLRNRTVLSVIKTLIKKVDAAVATEDVEKVQVVLRQAVKAISSAVPKGALHKNTASRKISKLVKRINTASTSAAA